MLTVAIRRPSWSLACATWTSRWVSTPTVTRGRSGCAMVVIASSFCRLGGGRHAPAGRADSTATGPGCTGSYQVTVARLVAPVVAAARDDRSCDKAPGQWNNGSDSRHDHHRQIIAASGTTGQTLATTTTARS